MYYCSENNSLEDELLNFYKVNFLMIASAFFSYEGLKIVKKVADKYHLSKKKIAIYLSEEFSVDKYYELLSELSKIVVVKIATRKKLHTKVFLTIGESKQHKVVFGSANMTKVGFENNIEFDQIKVVEDITDFNRFFKFIDYKAVEVNDDIITYYESNKAYIEELNEQQKN